MPPLHKFGIAIPTVNRADLLVFALLNYVKDFPEAPIYIYDNGQQGIIDIGGPDRVHLLGGDGTNLGVAGSWNLMAKKIFENCENAVILNDDIYLGLNEKHLAHIITTNIAPDRYGFISSMYDWCSFVLPKSTFELVGEFDEQFYPAYCEDSDYEYRMRLLGIKHLKTALIFPKQYQVSMTSKKEPEKYSDLFNRNKILYRKKWGGNPGHEKFKSPYNK